MKLFAAQANETTRIYWFTSKPREENLESRQPSEGFTNERSFGGTETLSVVCSVQRVVCSVCGGALENEEECFPRGEHE